MKTKTIKKDYSALIFDGRKRSGKRVKRISKLMYLSLILLSAVAITLQLIQWMSY